MEENILLKKVTEAFLESPKFTLLLQLSPDSVPPVDLSWIDKLRGKKLNQATKSETEKELKFYPPVVGTMYRIAARAVNLPAEIRGSYIVDTVLPLIHSHLDDLLYIIASALQNNRSEPESELIDFLRWNMPFDKISECVSSILDDQTMQSFYNSIVLAKGAVTILKPITSPNDGSE